jgi:hypothetical protein
VYFQLQFKLLNRRFKELGFEPWFAYILILLTLMTTVHQSFERYSFAPYVFVALCMLLQVNLGNQKRIDFLKTVFSTRKFRRIRLLENALMALPFMIEFIVYQKWIALAILGLTTILLALINVKISHQKTLPTPFSKRPFEFSVGFRFAFLLLIACYILMGIGLYVDNFNLGMFSILALFVVCMGFYTQPEDEFYVWIHHHSTSTFLFSKVKTALLNVSLLSAPLVLILLGFYPMNGGYIALFVLITFVFMIAVVLAKYAAYPNEIQLIQVFFLGISIPAPFLLLLFIPLFYNQATNRLKSYLK